MAEWLEGVDLLDPEAVAAAARPVMAAMPNPNGLDRAETAYLEWFDALCASMPAYPVEAVRDSYGRERAVTLDLLQGVGLDLMDGKDWCESATGVRA